MASSSGNSSSGSPHIQNSGSGEDLRKRKRMESNRESAKRSRMRKQQRFDDLTAQVAQLMNENKKISTTINITTQHYLNVEAENSVLGAQMIELTQRLDSLNQILNCVSCMFENEAEEFDYENLGFGDSFLNNPWNIVGVNNNYQHPIMASAEIFDY